MRKKRDKLYTVFVAAVLIVGACGAGWLALIALDRVLKVLGWM